MNLSEPFIRRPVATSLLALGVLLLGLTCYLSLPVAPLPNVDFPTIIVNASLPGVDPVTASTSLAAPLEKHLGQIPGIIEMTSSSTTGGCAVAIQFDVGRDIDGAARDVQAAINAAAHDLPPNLPSPPTYRKMNPSGMPVMILAMSSDTLPLSEVYNLADGIISQKLSQVKGVGQIGLFGGAKTAVRVEVDPLRIAGMGMSMNDVRDFLTNANHFAPLGAIQGGGRTYAIRSNDQLMKAADYRSLVISQTTNGIPIPLSAVADVTDGTENIYQGAWVHGKRAVIMPVFKEADANVLEITRAISSLLPVLRAWIPTGVHLDVISDRTQTIRASVNDVQFTLVLTSALVVLVMFLFLRKAGPTLVAAATVPLSLAGTFAVMSLCRYSLDNLSLMALTVAVGFLVDDAIIVIENIVRYLERGMSPLEAALEGTRQVGFTVVSMSLSLIAVFLPILLMRGIIGAVFHEFAVTLSASIIVSAIVSLSLTPSLCSRVLRGPRDGDGKTSGKSEGSLSAWLEGLYGHCLLSYENALDRVLRHPRATLVVFLASVVLTILLYAMVPKGFFPQQDTGLLFGATEGAQDISYGLMEKKQKVIAGIISSDPAVASVVSVISPTGGNSMNNGRFYISLKPLAERGVGVDAIIARLRPKFAAVKGIRVYLMPAQDLRMGGRSPRAQYQYALTADSVDPLLTWAPRLVEKLRSLPQLQDVNSDQQFNGLQRNVIVDRSLAGSLGIQPAQIDSILNNAFGQTFVSNLYTPLNQFHVVLVAPRPMMDNPDYLERIQVKTSGGKMIPLSAVAKFQASNAPLSVNHQGQYPVVTFSFNLSPGVSLGEAETLISRAEGELGMPPGIRGGFAGNALLFRQNATSQPLLIAAALLAVYIVLGMLYESLIHPLTILSTVPSAGLGALVALLLAGKELSIVAMIGILLLVGIVKKNAIMMVDFAISRRRSDGLGPKAAIREACLVRFRPILMTSVAAIFGSLPLAVGMGVGSELRQPLGVAIVGGLIVSQLLSLFTTPVIYLAMERLGEAGRSLGRKLARPFRRGSRAGGMFLPEAT